MSLWSGPLAAWLTELTAVIVIGYSDDTVHCPLFVSNMNLTDGQFLHSAPLKNLLSYQLEYLIDDICIIHIMLSVV